MLKFVYVKNTRIPVPVPVKNLAEAIIWLEQALCKDNQIITRIVLDGEEVNLDMPLGFEEIGLGSDSDLTVQIDEAKDLSIQTLEAVKNFAVVVLPRIKVLAVDLYDGPKPEAIIELEEVMQDLDIIFDLKHHINGILDKYHEALAPFEGLSYLAELVKQDLTKLQSQRKWKFVAVAIVSRLEPFLKELIKEIETLQIHIGENEEILLSDVG